MGVLSAWSTASWCSIMAKDFGRVAERGGERSAVIEVISAPDADSSQVAAAQARRRAEI